MKTKYLQVAVMLAAAAVLAHVWPAGVGEANSPQELSDAFANAAEDVKPAVVSIVSEKELRIRGRDMSPWFWFFDDNPGFRDFFEGWPRQGQRAPQREWKQTITGLGSGVIIDGKEGYILTNNHVVADADKLRVTLADKRTFTAEVKGTDPNTDIAIIVLVDKDKGDKLPQARLGRSENVRVGDWVLAIGSPYGLPQTVTAGIVSAKGRASVIPDSSMIQDFIQTDAAINRGNSGGPLVNLDGDVVGINTAIFSSSGGYDGIGFAIPIDMVNEILNELIEKGKVTRGLIGVMIGDVASVSDELAESLDIDVDYGAFVSGVIEDSPADEAGIQAGDVVLEFDGERIETSKELQRRAAATAPGTEVRVVVLRDGRKKNLSVTLGEMTDESAREPTAPFGETDLGMSVRELTPELARRFEIDEDTEGVVVTRVESGSPAARAGLNPGAVILEVNREPVKTVAEFNKATEKSRDDKSVLLLVQQEGMTRLVAIRLD